MRTAHSIWIVEVLAALAAFAWLYGELGPDLARDFLLTEIALFTIAFLSAVLLGGPGKVLLVGVGLGVLLPTLLAMATSGSGCSESDIVCFDSGLVFAMGVIVAGALYPGWALGTGLARSPGSRSAAGSRTVAASLP